MKNKKFLTLLFLLITSCSNGISSSSEQMNTSSNSNSSTALSSNSSTINTIISKQSSSTSNTNVNSSSSIGKKLDTPINLNIDSDYYLSWDIVNGASSYLVYINDIDLVVSDNKVDLFDYLYDGIRNTITVQAFDSKNRYEASEIAMITFDEGGPYEGIGFVEDNSFVENLEIIEENNQKVIEIPYDELARDESGLISDITITFDYDSSKYKFYYETDSNIIFANKYNGEPNTVAIAFRGIGEIELNVVKNGGNYNSYVFDSIIIRVVKSKTNSFSKFAIAYYDSNYELIETDSYTMGSSPEDYVWLSIIVGETDNFNLETDVTWSIVSGIALDLQFANNLGAYYVGCNVLGVVVIRATSCYGDIAEITITVK